jgi:hypothetical protein
MIKEERHREADPGDEHHFEYRKIGGVYRGAPERIVSEEALEITQAEPGPVKSAVAELHPLEGKGDGIDDRIAEDRRKHDQCRRN